MHNEVANAPDNKLRPLNPLEFSYRDNKRIPTKILNQFKESELHYYENINFYAKLASKKIKSYKKTQTLNEKHFTMGNEKSSCFIIVIA